MRVVKKNNLNMGMLYSGQVNLDFPDEQNVYKFIIIVSCYKQLKKSPYISTKAVQPNKPIPTHCEFTITHPLGFAMGRDGFIGLNRFSRIIRGFFKLFKLLLIIISNFIIISIKL